ncbi:MULTISPECIES: hypothetical protein [Tenacibaculum]|uniref:hypothetical protein n=1 Tax=Tenacibaculum TaxID=104267 RepID=UPI00089D01B0|nr:MULTISPECIES: hypothetical protein [unclassified Tenacibaculum]RBW56363.1 hypothetical protein DS884_12860 [Tenacibaculum sp. E3R01]SEE46821.1 hypothetical protein SAMN04487765_2701 [Tenacibaculum sp. MAR_2010_89]
MKNIKSVILLVTVLFFSCNENDSPTISLKDNTFGLCLENEPKLTDLNFTGTVCCFQRNSTLNIGTPIVYEYVTNLSDPIVKWEIISGDIEFLSGIDNNKVTIQLGNNFKNGKIKVRGVSSGGLTCDEVIIIEED